MFAVMRPAAVSMASCCSLRRLLLAGVRGHARRLDPLRQAARRARRGEVPDAGIRLQDRADGQGRRSRSSRSEDLSGDYEVDLAGQHFVAADRRGRGGQPHHRAARRPADRRSSARNISSIPTSASRSRHRPRTSVTVDGAVQAKAGSFPVGGPISLIQAVAMAKGTTEDANARRVAVFRTIGGQRQAAAFDLTAIRRGQAQDPQIYPGRHRRRRWIVDQGGVKADAAEHSRSCRSSGRSRMQRQRDGAGKREHQHRRSGTRASGRSRPMPPDVPALGPGQRTYSAASILDFPTLRPDHAPLALAGARRGRASACRGDPRHAADDARLSRLGDAGGQSADGRGQRRAIARSRTCSRRNTYRFRRDPGRAAWRAERSPSAPRRSSISPIIPTSSPQDGDASQRLTRGNRRRPERAQGHCARSRAADQVQLRFDLAAAGGAGRQRHCRQLHQHRRCSAATKRRLTPAISSSGRSTRPAATSSGPSGRSSLMPSSRASSTPAATGRRRQADGQRHQFASGRIAGPAQQRAWPPRRRAGSPPRAPIARRLATGPTSDVNNSVLPLRQQLAKLQADYQQKRDVHEAGASRDAQPAVADRRAAAADRQRRSRRRRPGGSTGCSRIIAARSRRSGRFRRGSPSSRATSSICAAAASSTRSCSARWTPTAASMTRCCSATSRSASPAASAWRRFRSSTAPQAPTLPVQAEPAA